MHMFYYVPIYDCKYSHPSAGATIFVLAGGTPCSPGLREEAWGILIFHLLN